MLRIIKIRSMRQQDINNIGNIEKKNVTRNLLLYVFIDIYIILLNIKLKTINHDPLLIVRSQSYHFTGFINMYCIKSGFKIRTGNQITGSVSRYQFSRLNRI